MVNAAEHCGATVVEKNFHMFSPYGVSGVVIISESHLAIHTWPEYGYAAVDLFTCGTSCDPLLAYHYLSEKLACGSSFYSELKRGLMNLTTQQMIESPFKIEVQGPTAQTTEKTAVLDPALAFQSEQKALAGNAAKRSTV